MDIKGKYKPTHFIKKSLIDLAHSNNWLDNPAYGKTNDENYDFYKNQINYNKGLNPAGLPKANGLSGVSEFAWIGLGVINLNLQKIFRDKGIQVEYGDAIVPEKQVIADHVSANPSKLDPAVLAKIRSKHSIATGITAMTPTQVIAAQMPVVPTTKEIYQTIKKPKITGVIVITTYDDGSFSYDEERVSFIPVPITTTEHTRAPMTWAPRTGNECYHNDKFYKSMAAGARANNLHRYQVKKNCINQINGWHFA